MTSRLVVFLVAVLACIGIGASVAHADDLKSSHYQFVESTLGEGGLTRANSANYQAIQAVGKAAVGETSGTGYQAHAGSNTTGDPALSVIINSGGGSFGAFTPTAASTATATFSVVDYTSYGYIVEIIGNPPSNGSHTIPAMSTPGASTPGTEQFGINLVKNTNFCGVGCNVGADPNYGQFGYTGAKPTTNYNTSGTFYYSNGDTIASSPKSSGQVTYTITYLINVKSLTPGGQYTSQQSIICIATY